MCFVWYLQWTAIDYLNRIYYFKFLIEVKYVLSEVETHILYIMYSNFVFQSGREVMVSKYVTCPKTLNFR